ncbi:MAG: hypothetical protein F6K28_46170 [Microcoleus sp. SIO2G3]|nr:hypothetical protein [Microcoleus sp. SIO2G3]
MSITVSGTMKKSNLGAGTLALNADDGQTYEVMHDAPKELLKDGQKVKVKGQIRNDVMSVAMIGPILEVESFEMK